MSVSIPLSYNPGESFKVTARRNESYLCIIIIFSQSIGSTHGVKAEGMSVLNTVAFMVGEIAGTGVLALPDALSATGKRKTEVKTATKDR